MSLLIGPLASAEALASPPANPELVARNYAAGAQASHALMLERLGIKVDILAGVATTTVSATFANPTASALEGDFALHLPPNSVVSGYALDLNGRLIDGVLVGERKATLAYQQRVRRGVDPGMAQATHDEAFRTHVFPIFPGRGRTVRLRFSSPVPAEGGYVLPLSTLDPVGVATVEVTSDAAAPPALEAPDGLDLSWTPGRSDRSARASATNVTLSGALRIAASAAVAPATLSLHRSGDRFFTLDAAVIDGPAAGASMERLRVFWDSSLSRRRQDYTREIALLTRYVAEARPERIELVRFADGEPTVESFASGEVLAAALRSTRYSGATSLARVFQAARGPADMCLLFSDGRVTLDAYAAMRLPCPAFTLSATADADHAFLTSLARASGGEHIDLRLVDVDQAVALLAHRAPRVVDVRNAAGESLPFTVLPAAAGRVRIIGRVTSLPRVALVLSEGRRLDVDLADLPVAEHDGAGDLWAADRVADLSASDRFDKEQVVRMARRYGVAAGGATFIVLEQLADYVDAEIAPPDSFGKTILADYTQQAAARATAKAATERERLTKVIAEWNEQKAWWAAKPRGVVHLASRSRGSAPLDGTSPRASPPPLMDVPSPLPLPPTPIPAPMVVAPPPPPPPPPPPMISPPAPALPAQSRRSRKAEEDVEVTAARRQGDAAAASPREAAIDVSVEPWDPHRPYLAALRTAPPERFEAVFDAQEEKYGQAPAFYLDVAEYLFRQGHAAEARSMALSALELPAADTTTLIILADRMMRYGDETRAIWLYEKVLYLDPDRPQPRRSLALALIERAERNAKRGGSAAEQRADYTRAMNLLNEVVTRPWDPAFNGIELVALMEANRILPRMQRLGVHDISLDRRLRALLDVDLRVVLEWNVDATDMDLWVDQPDGERAIYSNPSTAIGGRLSHDMTKGFGPEEYLLRHAPSGEYTVRVNIFATDTLNPNGPINVRARLFRAYGRLDERSEELDLELKPGEQGARVVGELKVAAPTRGRKD